MPSGGGGMGGGGLGGGGGGMDLFGGVLGMAGTIFEAIGRASRLKDQATYARKIGRAERRKVGLETLQHRGTLRLLSQGRAGGDTLHARLMADLASGVAMYEAQLPYEIARAQLRYQAKQELIAGVTSAFGQLGSAASSPQSEEFLSGLFGSRVNTGTMLAPRSSGGSVSRSSLAPLGTQSWQFFRASPRT